jgi:hypothetical protein
MISLLELDIKIAMRTLQSKTIQDHLSPIPLVFAER